MLEPSSRSVMAYTSANPTADRPPEMVEVVEIHGRFSSLNHVAYSPLGSTRMDTIGTWAAWHVKPCRRPRSQTKWVGENSTGLEALECRLSSTSHRTARQHVCRNQSQRTARLSAPAHASCEALAVPDELKLATCRLQGEDDRAKAVLRAPQLGPSGGWRTCRGASSAAAFEGGAADVGQVPRQVFDSERHYHA